MLEDSRQAQLVEISERLAYQFTHLALLERALTHSSYAFERGGGSEQHNETLEFLGDAVLDLGVGYELFRRFPLMKEGELSKFRAALVNETRLADVAKNLGLGEFLLLGKGETASHGRDKASILAGAFEAAIGAIFLDGGYAAAMEFVERHFSGYMVDEWKTVFLLDAKSRLQELIQETRNETPVYVLELAEGPDHDKIFTVSVRVKDEILAIGKGKNKKHAEQAAAAEALDQVLQASEPN